MINDNNRDRKKRQFIEIDGVLLLDKPAGLTSNDALQVVKRAYSAAKAGHTGSLDPIATGMLPICFGEATKFSQFLLDADKTYQVTCKLGVTTSTADSEGEILETRALPKDLSREKIAQILPQFLGEQEQIPPMHSAIKHQGKPLYKLARQGVVVERAARKINIYELKLFNFDADAALLELVVRCSKGTYVRTLVEDLGRKLDCGAHVVGLRRLAVGEFKPEQMHDLGAIERTARDVNGAAEIAKLLLPIGVMVEGIPEVVVTNMSAYYLQQGQAVMVPQLPVSSGLVKLRDKDGDFLGVGEVDRDGKVAPRRLVRNRMDKT